MKLSQSTKNILYFALVIPSTIIGANTGSIIYTNKVLTNGILGTTALLLMYLAFFKPLKDFFLPETGIQAEFPRDFKYIFLGFFLSAIGYCSLRYVIELAQAIYHYVIY